MTRGDVLRMVVFCFLLGMACNAVGAKAAPVAAFDEARAEIAFRYTRHVMYLAPFAVFAALAVTVAGNGSGVLAGVVLLGSLLVAGVSIDLQSVAGAFPGRVRHHIQRRGTSIHAGEQWSAFGVGHCVAGPVLTKWSGEDLTPVSR